MASKKDEERAFKKLCDAAGSNRHCVLELTYAKYNHLIEPKIEYHAYIEFPVGPRWGSYFTEPMEAVDDTIKIFQEKKKELEDNEPNPT